MENSFKPRVNQELPPFQTFLSEVYGEDTLAITEQETRLERMGGKFRSLFPDRENSAIFSVPGRTELGGNHTDHENGLVLAAAVNLDTLAIAALNSEDRIRIHSEGYPTIDLIVSQIEAKDDEKHTSTALAKGVCKFLSMQGARLGGFDAVITSNVPHGSGLSSSASFEVTLALIQNHFYNEGRLDSLALARAGQFAESTYYDKPCGLMDQIMVSFGGMAMIDFQDEKRPVISKIQLDLIMKDHVLVITETGGDHTALTGEYAAIIADNRAIARYFGADVLRGVRETDFQKALPALREKVGDRAILRAIHFFKENKRVVEQKQSLEKGDIQKYLELVNESGRSSWMLLQNCYSTRNPREQGIPLGLEMSAKLLGERGAWRVQGGGFAGTIQAYVPRDLNKLYIAEMESLFGARKCHTLSIRSMGAVVIPDQ